MDRNRFENFKFKPVEIVALRKESVDRNFMWIKLVAWLLTSLSARRAWIEISSALHCNYAWQVALRKESVDRNHASTQSKQPLSASLSARRAWIEILVARPGVDPGGVALRKESVDRNLRCLRRCQCFYQSLSARRAWIEIVDDALEREVLQGRSPQGERG